MNGGVSDDDDLREEVKRLRDEQSRLRRDQDELKKHVDESGQEGDGDKKPPEKKDDEANKPEDAKKPEEGKKPDDPGKKPGPWVRTHPIALVVIVVVLIAVAIGGFLLLQYFGSYVSTDDAQVDGHINAVSSRISGAVVGVYIEDNQVVKAGQTLVDIDPRDYKVSLEQSQAQLLQAQAGAQAQNPNVPITQTTQTTNVTTSNSDVTTAEAALSQAKQNYQASVAQLRQAEATAARARSDEERYRLLVAKDEVSKEQYDQKLTDAKAQQAVVDAQKASADAARDTIAQRQAALDQSRQRLAEARQNAPRAVEIQKANLVSREADVQRAKAAVDQSLLNLSYAKIAAPISGVVGRRSVEVGQQISPGQQLLAITNVSDLWVTANFKETQLRNMRPNQSVRIHVDAIKADYDGYVESLAGASGAKYSLLPPENATGNYVKVVQRLPVRIRFKSDQSGLDRLRPGMSVEPKVMIQ